MSDLKKNAQDIHKLTQEMSDLKRGRDLKLAALKELEQKRVEGRVSQANYDKQIKLVNSDKSIENYNGEIDSYLVRIKGLKDEAFVNLKKSEKPKIAVPRIDAFDLNKAPLPPEEETDTKYDVVVDKASFKRFTKNLGKAKKKESEEFSVYKTNFYSKIAQYFMGELVFNLTMKHKDLYNNYNEKVHLANIKLLTKTYISIAFFSTIISLPIITLVAFLYFMNVWYAVAIGFAGMITTGILFYFYPYSLIKNRQNKIKVELVFATVHMAAVSGSGANPEKIFKLLIESKEYPELEPDLKRILNNLNLFGYNLTTSLKSVARSVASPDFKDLLNGMVSTIETGGDLTQYLQEKARDALDTFRLDQKRYLARLSSFSDVYTGLLIAAPLLFVVTLAVLDKVSPSIGGVPIAMIANLGTYVGLPLLNALFFAVLNIFQPEL